MQRARSTDTKGVRQINGRIIPCGLEVLDKLLAQIVVLDRPKLAVGAADSKEVRLVVKLLASEATPFPHVVESGNDTEDVVLGETVLYYRARTILVGLVDGMETVAPTTLLPSVRNVKCFRRRGLVCTPLGEAYGKLARAVEPDEQSRV